MCKQSKRKTAAKKLPEESEAISGIQLDRDAGQLAETDPPVRPLYPHRLRYTAWKPGYTKLRRWTR